MPVARRWTVALASIFIGIGSLSATAQDVASPQVEYKDIDGVRYQVTRQVVKETVPITVMQDRQQTFYAPQTTTENISHQQMYSVPVTQNQVVPVLVGRWNPFVTPYWAYEVEQVTTWQNQVANVQIPVNRVTWAPQTKTVQVPVTEYRTAEREIITRVAVSNNSTNNSNQALATAQPLSSAQPQSANPVQSPYRSATIAARPSDSGGTTIGGTVMPSDPPRQATGNWQTPPVNSRYR
ncbi:hypothetical protein [Bythopirellula polymerisocia]|uniref:Secreted protein n=1 Tax=Bythopirellula polymerisocia TaxID=2528003 RepID=A0A5C6CEN4_9BACT|nr:hypothetical protein [Bythopirellula polymerisocia]TWU22562.1 hypothetical protein Pla144_40210 [Bythopirellula polymerisocia]